MNRDRGIGISPMWGSLATCSLIMPACFAYIALHSFSQSLSPPLPTHFHVINNPSFSCAVVSVPDEGTREGPETLDIKFSYCSSEKQ